MTISYSEVKADVFRRLCEFVRDNEEYGSYLLVEYHGTNLRGDLTVTIRPVKPDVKNLLIGVIAESVRDPEFRF